MSRRIVTNRLQSHGTDGPDTYFDRLVKYIPGDIIAAWVAVSGFLESTDSVSSAVEWIIFVVFVAITGAWVIRFKEGGRSLPRTQAAISTIAFVIWVFALGRPFNNLDFYAYDPVHGSIAIVLYTLIVALIIPKED